MDAKLISLTRNFSVYNGCEPYIIAEIGANHNGDLPLAKKMIDSAKACGANAVKFQSWTPTSFIAQEEYDRNQTYDDSPKKHFGSLKEMVEKYYLTEDDHFELFEYCKLKNIDFSSSSFSYGEVDLLDELGVDYFKLASMDINNIELVKYTAKKNKPVLLSTGMSTLGEIEQAIRAIEDVGNKKIILLHCVSLYPPKYDDINLKNISMLQRSFGYPVGFSDHTFGYSISLASVSLGACIIEKHFTLDKNLSGWDHEISANPSELNIIVQESKNIHKALGTYRRIVSFAEDQKKLKFRRSIVLNKSVKKGHIISHEDLDYKRPGTKIPPDQMIFVIGRKVKHNLEEDYVLTWGDLE